MSLVWPEDIMMVMSDNRDELTCTGAHPDLHCAK